MDVQDMNMGQEDPGGISDSFANKPYTDDENTKVSPINRSNLALAVMFAAGIASVYMLSFSNGPEIASAQQRQVEMRVDNALSLLGKPSSSARGSKLKAMEVIESFYCEARGRQIPLNKLTTNPFVFEPTRFQARPLATKPEDPKQTDPRQANLKEAMAAAESLTLQSVLKGSHGATAMISNNLLAEGQKIGCWTISKIRPREVVLTWNDHKYVLKML